MRIVLASLLAVLAMVSPALAGNFAERHIFGFSPDGRYFASEQFGTQDGSGSPYADIFLIDTRTDAWVEGSPYRVLLKDERAKLQWARREVTAKAGNALREHVISHPGTLLASNPPGELSTDPHEVSVNPRFAVPSVREPWRFRLTEKAIPVARCTDLLGGPTKGYRATVTPFGGGERVLHDDMSVPESRGCFMGYALSDVIMFDPGDGPRVFVLLVSVYSFGFEGPDRRFIAVPHVAP
jgi:predicted secreted protein